MSEIIWNEHIVEGTLNGEKVRFKCKYRSKDIYVEMIEPFQPKFGIQLPNLGSKHPAEFSAELLRER